MEPESETIYSYKIVLIGDGGVGKTSLRRRYMGEGFTKEYLNTVGADYSYLTNKVGNNIYRWSIWDLAGQPKFSNVRPVFYAGAFGSLLCFDVTRDQTFENLDNWINELEKHNDLDNTPIVLVACKMDLYEEEGQVDFDEVLEYKQNLVERSDGKRPVSMIKTSALTGMNIDDAFNSLREGIKRWVDERD